MQSATGMKVADYDEDAATPYWRWLLPSPSGCDTTFAGSANARASCPVASRFWRWSLRRLPSACGCAYPRNVSWAAMGITGPADQWEGDHRADAGPTPHLADAGADAGRTRGGDAGWSRGGDAGWRTPVPRHAVPIARSTRCCRLPCRRRPRLRRCRRPPTPMPTTLGPDAGAGSAAANSHADRAPAPTPARRSGGRRHRHHRPIRRQRRRPRWPGAHA